VTPNDRETQSSSQPPSPISQPTRIVESRELFGGDSEILISHGGATYRMRITRQGKLILNK